MRPAIKIERIKKLSMVDLHDFDNIKGVDWQLSFEIIDSFIFDDRFIFTDPILEALKNERASKGIK